MRLVALMAVVACLSGCADAAGPGGFTSAPGLPALGKPGAPERRRQVLLDVAAMAEGMEGARLSRGRSAGM